MKLKLTPQVFATDGKQSAGLVAEADLDNELRIAVSASDATLGRGGSGPSLRDVHVKVSVGGDADNRQRNGQGFALEYDVENSSPVVELNSRMTLPIKSKSVTMSYRHGLRKNTSALRADMDIDDKTRVSLNYNPDAAYFNLGNILNESEIALRYEADEKTVVEPRANLRNRSFGMKITRQINDDSKVSLLFDSHTQDGTLELTQRMSDGDVRVTCTGNLTADGMKRMPTVMVQKDWSLDF